MTTLSSLTLTFLERHPDDAARVLEQLPPDQSATLLADTPARAIGPVVERMLPSPAGQALNALDDPGIAAILGAMGTHSATALLRHLPARRGPILKLLPRHTARAIRRQLEYPAETVGAWMDPTTLRMRASTPVEQALELVRRRSDEDFDTFYVVGEDQTLIGWVEVARLVRARARLTVGQLAQRPPHVLKATADLLWVRDEPAWLQTPALPVLDHRRLVGTLRYLDLHRGLQAHAPVSGNLPNAQTVEAAIQLYWSLLTNLLASGLAWIDALARSAEGKGARGR